MKIKLDENIPSRLVNVLSLFGHEVDTVSDEGLAGQDDTFIWDGAQKAGRFLITQDMDFSDIRRFIPGTHHGLLLLRLRVPGRRALTERVKFVFETEDVEQWKQCFVVVSEHKIRVRHPAK